MTKSSDALDGVTIAKTLDTCGLFCPEPVMMLHQVADELNPHDVVEVWATDPSTERDIPKFCQFLDHTLLLNESVDGKFRFLIRL